MEISFSCYSISGEATVHYNLDESKIKFPSYSTCDGKMLVKWNPEPIVASPFKMPIGQS